MGLLLNLSCTKNKNSDSGGAPRFDDSESFPIETSKLQGCRFEVTQPTYTVGQTVPANRILCDEGVATKLEVLTPTPLPKGLTLDLASRSIIGKPEERVIQAPYQIYLENEAGYLVIPITLTVR